MALQVKAIQQKMKSVGNIKKITKTMEMISVSKMRRAVAQAQASKPYSEAVMELISYLTNQEELVQENIFFKQRTEGKSLVIIISSNKGLCGAYNMNVFKKLAALKGTIAEELDCITIGKHSEKSARKLGLSIIASFVKLPEKTLEGEISVLSKIAIEQFVQHNYREVFLIYTEFSKALTFTPISKKLLPLDVSIITATAATISQQAASTPKKESLAEYLFEPSKAFIMETALPKMLHFIIYQACLESLASEHSARMLAMKNASDNATDIFKNLKLSFNHARQDGITKELSEIVGGASALE